MQTWFTMRSGMSSCFASTKILNETTHFVRPCVNTYDLIDQSDETSVARDEVGSSALDDDYLRLVPNLPPQNTDFQHGDERRLYVLLSSSTFAQFHSTTQTQFTRKILVYRKDQTLDSQF